MTKVLFAKIVVHVAFLIFMGLALVDLSHILLHLGLATVFAMICLYSNLWNG